VSEIASEALSLARPHARELGSDAPLEEIERIVREGNGADRQRKAHSNGGMTSVLELLVSETNTRGA
jgi:gamma-glutamyl:cysteine ligase YbdK (ATP-grasp superfamily)